MIRFLTTVCAITLGVASTSTIRHLPNGCAVVAREYEAQAKTDLSGRHVWAHVVTFLWARGGHAVCVFTMSNGDVWSYDHIQGSVSLHTKKLDIESIRAGLEPYYPWCTNPQFVD